MSPEKSRRAPSLIQWLGTNLRAKLALGLALPSLIVLSAISLINYQRNQQMVSDQVEHMAEQLGDVTLGAVRHGMLMNDPKDVADALDDLVAVDNILQAQILGLGGETAFASADPEAASTLPDGEITCTVCHQYPADLRPRSIQFGNSRGIVRVASPIPNEPACTACHNSESSHLGILLVDVSFADLDLQLQSNLQTNLAISGASAILVAVIVYLLSHWYVVRPLERFKAPLARFVDGDFTARVPDPGEDSDEIGALATAFNQMVEALEREKRAASARSQVRQRAIMEERDRIARELHDGVAQLLAYVNTKAIAARLRVADGHQEAAIEILRQLENAAKDLFTDVREAILALKSTNGPGLVFPENLRSFIERFEELSGLPVETDLDPDNLPITLPPETELQLLRITQEALANTRKHSGADWVRVSVAMDYGDIELVIADNGSGFDPTQSLPDGRAHFGLSTMRERALAIGAELELDSRPGEGTKITLRAQLPKVG
jgi:signal transduction histidine kinase